MLLSSRLLVLAINLLIVTTAASDEVAARRQEEAANLRAVYINLDKRPDRKEHLELLLNKYDVPYTRFPAVYGLDIMDYLHDGKALPFTLCNGTAFHPDVLKPYLWEGDEHYGRIGCWQSHVQVLLGIVEDVEARGLPDGPVLILEDDITWPESFGKHGLLKHIQELPDDWELIVYGLIGRACKPTNHTLPKEFCHISRGFRAHAYIVRNVSAAKKMLSVLNTKMPQVLDLHWNKAFRSVVVAYGTGDFIIQRNDFGTEIPDSARNKPPHEPFWHRGK